MGILDFLFPAISSIVNVYEIVWLSKFVKFGLNSQILRSPEEHVVFVMLGFQDKVISFTLSSVYSIEKFPFVNPRRGSVFEMVGSLESMKNETSWVSGSLE